MIRIALDAMGGDHAPGEIIRGGVEGADAYPDVEVVFVGDASVVRDELSKYKWPEDRVRIEHASEVVGMNEHPVESLRRKPDSSISKMLLLAKAKEVEAVVSAGNTGACVAGCQVALKRLRGVTRAGIAVVIPSFHGPIVVCDAGANVAARAQHLHQYAVMASIYARAVIGVKSPRVGLLSIGEEDAKGTDVVKKARELLRADEDITFVGNVEGRDIFRGACDVVACDGFAGNITLKLTEGLAEGLFKTITREIQAAAPQLEEAFKPVLRNVWAAHDYSEYGGAPLLGVNGVCIICHGRSDHRAIRNAVRAARECVVQGLNSIFVEQLAEGVGLAR